MSAPANFVFLHGGGQGGWVWDETVAALHLQADSAAVRTLQLDIPGCGAKRGRDTSAIGMQDIAAELIADVEQAGLTDIILVGHSQAGQILPIITESRPDLIRKLVYISCVIQAPGLTIHDQLGDAPFGTYPDKVGWIFDPRTESFADHFPRMFMNDMPPAQAATFGAKLGKDAWPPASYAATDWRYDHLAGLPSTYIVCSQDNCLPAHWQQRFATRVHAQHVIHVDCGHQIMNTRPHALAEILLLEAAG